MALFHLNLYFLTNCLWLGGRKLAGKALQFVSPAYCVLEEDPARKTCSFGWVAKGKTQLWEDRRTRERKKNKVIKVILAVCLGILVYTQKFKCFQNLKSRILLSQDLMMRSYLMELQFRFTHLDHSKSSALKTFLSSKFITKSLQWTYRMSKAPSTAFLRELQASRSISSASCSTRSSTPARTFSNASFGW